MSNTTPNNTYLKPQESQKIIDAVEELITESGKSERILIVRIVPGDLSKDVRIGRVPKGSEFLCDDESVIDWENYDW